MRIAIPIWYDKVSPVLDTASKLLIVEVEDGKESARYEIYLDEPEISRRCARIQGWDVDILICGAVSRPFWRLLEASGIDIIQNISGHTEDVLNAYLKGNILRSGFVMPGCKHVMGKYGENSICEHRGHRKRQKTGRNKKQKEVFWNNPSN
ncbi:MAG: NifB/NifX family molybdenum-iron cluster-binding protein [Pseudomonadota bacterium]